MPPKTDNPRDPQNHQLWADFKAFADANGIDLEYQDDWDAWWNCFLAGSAAQFRLYAVGE